MANRDEINKRTVGIELAGHLLTRTEEGLMKNDQKLAEDLEFLKKLSTAMEPKEKSRILIGLKNGASHSRNISLQDNRSYLQIGVNSNQYQTGVRAPYSIGGKSNFKNSNSSFKPQYESLSMTPARKFGNPIIPEDVILDNIAGKASRRI